jgi:peptidoglycan/LPS O-acetylase OafA/YrhL
MTENHYRHLAVMAAVSFLAMYILMYAMVYSFDHVYMSINQFYMAGLMAAPMVLIEVVVMRRMYHDKRLNALIAAGSVVVGVLMFVFIRQQTGVSDGQFLRSMIPHHSGAILMCERASVQDTEIRTLCTAIVTSQQAEIHQMTAALRRLQDVPR